MIDKGRGFDPVKVHKEVAGKQSFGLLSMKERVELLNGEFELTSAPGKGTTIRVSIPITPVENEEEGKVTEE